MGDLPVRRIRPRSARLLPDFREIWRYRDLARMFGLRDFRLRYRQTIVGVAWVFLQPLMGAAAFTVVFGIVADLPSEGVPYFLFALVGMCAWTIFASGFTRVGASLLQNSQLVGKTYFPRTILPLSTLASVLIDLVVGLGLLGILLIATSRSVPMQALLLPVWIIGMLMLSLGPGLIAAAVSASYRDVQYATPLLIQALLYISPVGYSAASVPLARPAAL